MPEQTPQESIFQIKIDQQKELLQKDIQTREKEIAHLKELMARQEVRIADIDKHTSRFGVLLTIVLSSTVFLTYISVNSLVKTQAKDWFTENSKRLRTQIVELEEKAVTVTKKMDIALKRVEEHEAKVHKELDQAKKRMQQALNDNRPIEAEDEKLIAEQATQLKDKPESSYSYEDWNTRAFDAWINKKLELAADRWEQAASVPSASSVDRARALFNQGVALGRLGRREDEIAVYDRLIKAYGSGKEPALRERVAKAIFNKGVTLGELDRREDALAVYDRLIRDYGSYGEPALREQVAKAMFNKAVTLGKLGHNDDALAIYNRLIKTYDHVEEPALRKSVANAMNGKGYALLLKAKRHWSDISLRQDLLTQANDSFEQAMQRLPNNAMMLGNSAYCAWLLGRTEFAEKQFKKALGADGGGERLYNATLDDLAIDPVDADQGFRDLIDRLYKSYQGKR